jgi:hypothetical protein
MAAVRAATIHTTSILRLKADKGLSRLMRSTIIRANGNAKIE